MLKLSPERLAYEAERAAEIQRADAALRRERLLWYFAAIGCMLVGTGIGLAAYHVTSGNLAMFLFSAGTLIIEVGPLVILVVAIHREQT